MKGNFFEFAKEWRMEQWMKKTSYLEGRTRPVVKDQLPGWSSWSYLEGLIRLDAKDQLPDGRIKLFVKDQLPEG